MSLSLQVQSALAFVFLFFAFSAAAQDKYVLSGYVKDAATGETLIGAAVVVADSAGLGTVTNAYGFYSLEIPAGTHRLRFSYVGYAGEEATVTLNEAKRLNVELAEESVELQEVVVKARPDDANVKSTEMGTVGLQMDNVKKLPALMGEVDVLKTIQLLPGVLSAGEGNAGFYVRGGGPDQNLVLLDEAVVYNPGHLLGFFSVFNADAIKNTTLIKGGMPAQYGGRLSSVVDIQMKEGNDREYAMEGGIGLVASRVTFEGPIVEERSSFIVSARRTYALDLAQPFFDNTSFAGTNYYFYDLNAKANYRFSDEDRLYFSTYFGRDVLQFRSNARDFNFDMPYGNATATLRWNHLFSDKLFMNVSAIYNDYDFGFSGGQGDFRIGLESGVRDWNGKVDFEYFPNPNHHLRFGANYTYHRLTPSLATATNGEEVFANEGEIRFAHESAVYLADEIKIGPGIRLNAGLRVSAFTQLGPYTSKQDSTEYAAGEPVKTYIGVEPRLAATFYLNAVSSLKAGVTVANQYLHLVSNSTSTLPTDIWMPSSEIIKPQIGVQYAVGYFRNFQDNRYEASVEVYYRDLYNQIDFRENYVDNVANDLEEEFVFGQGRAYGLELFLQKKKGRFTGWIGYTLSRTERIFPEINNGNPFPAIYDRRHDLSVVANYTLNKKWEFGGAFIFGTGNAFTPVQRLYFIDQFPVQEYGPRNSARLQDYHRVDFSATYTPKPDSKARFRSSWNFSVYNAYSRQNPFFIYYDFESDPNAGTAAARAYQVSLFPVIPSVTWNFSWR
ncbi:MAG: TonB-dependent receptor [Phaeodactylibacter xiamenensis]|uniref:TonB-dependent receptor n=1 Tax=Phaeodactylibacter xiamenensis TaxID=1524460 RepID=A0A098S2D3_9BACT|nr:TonB-dependent receptor [Phaeodactylibacter xiamenensis]KGE86524.1 TonB-dependent receptor [Phaeodactylibacter xiamenensis]MCR9050887.1 TonB-dependent receptor [bacterium]